MFSNVADPSHGSSYPSGTSTLYLTTRCPYYSRSLPFIGSLQEHLAPSRVAVLGVALDGQGARYESAVDMASNWTVFAPPDVRTAAQLRVYEVPTLAFIDQAGTVAKLWTGELDESRVDEIVSAVRRLQ